MVDLDGDLAVGQVGDENDAVGSQPIGNDRYDDA